MVPLISSKVVKYIFISLILNTYINTDYIFILLDFSYNFIFKKNLFSISNGKFVAARCSNSWDLRVYTQAEAER